MKRRKRKFCRRSRSLQERKKARTRNRLKPRAKKELEASVVRSRATLLDRIIRQCRRSTVTVTELHRNMRSILQTCLQNCFNTLEGETTISVAQAAKEANVSARAVAHTKVFLSTGKIVQNSRRGGKRKGRSLLDCEVFTCKQRGGCGQIERAKNLSLKRMYQWNQKYLTRSMLCVLAGA